MPPSKKNGAGKSNGNSGNKYGITWVNYDLTSKDKEWLSSANVASEFPPGMVDDIVFEGYKFGLSPDARNSCFVASLTDKVEGGAFYNHCLTGRGATPAAARISLLYRHVVLAQGDWSFFHQPSNTADEIYG